MNDFLYCIIHEQWTHPSLFDCLPKECILTTSEPPELPEGWEETVEPPTSDEMILIDQNATELALDLELV